MERVHLPFVLAAAFLLGCRPSPPVQTASLPGMELDECIAKLGLDRYECWATPNLPPGADAELTYFMPRGNLYLQVNPQQRITSAEFEASSESPKQRLGKVHKAWHEYVTTRTRGRPQTANPADP